MLTDHLHNNTTFCAFNIILNGDFASFSSGVFFSYIPQTALEDRRECLP